MSTAPLLTREEVNLALVKLAGRGKEARRIHWRNSLVIFALVTCAGMTATEIAELNLGDYEAYVPCFRIGQRVIPITWNALAGKHIAAYGEFRTTDYTYGRDPFVCTLRGSGGGRLTRGNVTKAYVSACRICGIAPDRRRVSLGVDSFIANAMDAGIDATVVRAVRGMPLLPGERPAVDPLSYANKLS